MNNIYFNQNQDENVSLEFQSYEMLTNRVIKSIEEGCAPWQKSLKVEQMLLLAPKNYKNKNFYKGKNFLNLFYATIDCGYPSSLWLTINQIEKIGAKVKRGETPHNVEFWLFRAHQNASNYIKDANIIYTAYPKIYDVYNIAQTTLEVEFHPKEIRQNHHLIEKIVENYGISVSFKPDLLTKMAEGLYDSQKHAIYIPNKEYFNSNGAYYTALLHELAHSTAKRLGRKEPQNDEENAFEELVAELTSFFLCAKLKVDFDPKNSASYINAWAKLLKEPKTSILKASFLAQNAANFLLEFSKDKKQKKQKCA